MALTTTGQDDYATFTPMISGSLYLSFLANFASALTGDYFIALSTPTNQTNYYARLHAKASGSGFLLGISKNNEVTGGAAYGTTVLNFNQTYLIVVKYKFISILTTDDEISVFVFADPTLPATEPLTPEVGPYVNATKPDVTELGIVTLRQGSSTTAPALTIDGIRVGPSWADAPLPVQLSSFTGMPVGDRSIRLDWTTVSEINNFGFFVQRRAGREVSFTDLPNSFVTGSGTTNERREYRFTDTDAPNGATFYRLRQVDLDRTEHFSEPIQVNRVTSVAGTASRIFALEQNYPNPFNPKTSFESSVPSGRDLAGGGKVPSSGLVTLKVYDVLGREVATLVNEVKQPGTYTTQWNATNLPSGVYHYQLVSGVGSGIKKMMLLK